MLAYYTSVREAEQNENLAVSARVLENVNRKKMEENMMSNTIIESLRLHRNITVSVKVNREI